MQFKKFKVNSKIKNDSASASGQSVGIDITQKSICMVQLSASSPNQFSLEKYTVTALPKNIVIDSNIEDIDQLVAYLQQGWQQLRTNCKNISVSIPQKITNLQFLHYSPQQSESDLAEFIQLELAQFDAPDALSYDYISLEGAAEDQEQDILLVSCNREDVDLRVDAYTAAEINPTQMSVDVLAVMNAFNTWINQQQPELVGQILAIFNVGISYTSALIVRNERILYKQEINLGYEHIMQLIRRNYQLAEDDAWSMIRDAKKPDDYQEKIGNQFQEQFVQEVQRVMQYYYTTNQVDDNNIQHILISGYTGTGTTELASYVQQQVHIATQQVNPVMLAQQPKQKDKSQFLQDSNLLTVAFGLAVQGL